MNNPRPTMRAATLIAPGKFEIQTVPTPTPCEGQVRIKIETCGVCSSNLPPWQGRPWFTYPFAPGALGHEATGRIDSIGKGIVDWQVGDRVAALSQHAYAEYDIAQVDQLIKLPVSLDGHCFPGEPLGCVMNIMERALVRPGDRVAVVGVGFLGALIVQQCLHLSAQVFCTGRRAWSLNLAEKWGARTVSWNAANRTALVKDFTDSSGSLFDVVFETTGAQESVDLAAELTRERGRLIIAGYHQDGLRQVNLQLWNWRGIDVINAHERDPKRYVQGMENALQATLNGSMNYEPLLTHFMPLEKLGEALRLTQDRPDGFMKAVVKMD